MKLHLNSVIIVIIMLFTSVSSYAAFPLPNVDSTSSVVIAEQSAPKKSPARQQMGRKEQDMGAGFGIAALACGVAGLFVLAIPLGICAIIFGIIGLNRRMKGLAIAGLALGILDVIAGIIIIASVL